ncbi:B3 domain-containing protein At3g19184-like isoform X3 [Herrania umbratica]|uniref:B3 domain-containing protein At3g19184-like isoform X3 n=1 Tax=Herrania umbratica TaxID=108875 RepID=A0A6J0ZZK1_9ROSI|nr:B3 domain-containing protein At3g19184-like isoform X3 [Herrania umbratica]
MVAAKSTYEQMRKRRLEENKKRMEELNLKNLSQALKNTSPKPSPMKPRTPRQRVDLTAVRRSSRVADKPKPNYKDIPLEPLERPRRGHSRRNLWDRVYASDEERAYAIERAEHLQSTLESDYPSFVKPMLQSHVTGGFWLGLPVQFCKKHLPDQDEMITLVDEKGEEFPTKYLAEKTGLSGGWRGFSLDHNLVDGDALVFQLVTPTEFKVYIIRAYESEDNEDGEPGEEDDKEPDVQVLDRSAKRIRARK